ncbi:type VI secretion system baseplate subunit TssE [Pelagibaculum spongiae]|uniref:Type VI secretion system baseplate subunit TssE n=1 Tax=Pelagibaculum spongiae TaxID=2080658 RepID=A0A2V1GWZ9_9GAMM|nr:type VI secretion system baseplate subunit TssE [Pelagibaculum spongiae]PVZ68774.1 type VI secretion system baseplate subunit TssE [Pelagibaculum spongiae]
MSYQENPLAWGVGLFERLHSDAPGYSKTLGPDPHTVLASIKKNISHLLNSRAGASLSCPELGLIDFNDATLGSHDLALRIKNAIYLCVTRYEPRISQLQVEVMFDDHCPLNLRFKLQAVLNATAFHNKLQIDLLLDSSRQYRVL